MLHNYSCIYSFFLSLVQLKHPQMQPRLKAGNAERPTNALTSLSDVRDTYKRGDYYTQSRATFKRTLHIADKIGDYAVRKRFASLPPAALR